VKHKKWIEAVVLCVGLLYTLFFLFVAAKRLMYPYEVEWNEGAILDHALRVVDGKPLYTAPSLAFASFVYTPLYYYITALILKVGGVGLWAGRLISIVSTIFTAYLIRQILWKETANSVLSLLGAMLFLAFYHATGFFYDIVRMDALATMLAISSIYSALYIRRGEVFAAILIVLAYLTKQQMIAFWPALVVGLLIIDRHRAIIFVAISLALVTAAHILLNWTSNGWYAFYTSTIPGIKAKKLFSWSDAIQFFPRDFFGAFGIASIAILTMFALRTKRFLQQTRRMIAIGLCYLAAIGSGALSMGNSGGYVNVLIPLAVLSSVLLPIAARHLSEDFLRRPQLAAWLLLLQFASLAYNPLRETMLIPGDGDRQAGDQLIASIGAIPGDIWIPFHGYLSHIAGKGSHIHFMAMNDALIPGDSTSKRFQRQIDSSFEHSAFAAIVLDDDSVYKWRAIPHYQRVDTLLRTQLGFASRIGEAPTRPNFVYRPKQ
jgi:hypothetical protein